MRRGVPASCPAASDGATRCVARDEARFDSAGARPHHAGRRQVPESGDLAASARPGVGGRPSRTEAKIVGAPGPQRPGHRGRVAQYAVVADRRRQVSVCSRHRDLVAMVGLPLFCLQARRLSDDGILKPGDSLVVEREVQLRSVLAHGIMRPTAWPVTRVCEPRFEHSAPGDLTRRPVPSALYAPSEGSLSNVLQQGRRLRHAN